MEKFTKKLSLCQLGSDVALTLQNLLGNNIDQECSTSCLVPETQSHKLGRYNIRERCPACIKRSGRISNEGKEMNCDYRFQDPVDYL